MPKSEVDLRLYYELQKSDVERWLAEILNRAYAPEGKRQVVFNPVETLLCYGLFYIIDPHHYGGSNLNQLPDDVPLLASFFKRTASSITSKMLNLDGSRSNSARAEPLLFAELSADPGHFLALYKEILLSARQMGISDLFLPDFLGVLNEPGSRELLLGQEDVPSRTVDLLRNETSQMDEIEEKFHLGDRLTEQIVEQKVRLVQHRFARMVLQNYHHSCAFCGFSPKGLPTNHGLLRASHIKPWAVCTPQERVEVGNGIAACPTHDAAFDRGWLGIDEEYRIRVAATIQNAVTSNSGAAVFFQKMLSVSLILPPGSTAPQSYFSWMSYPKGPHYTACIICKGR